MNEFDMETKVKLMFALRAPVNPKFLIEIMKHAEVEVNDQQIIMKYKQENGGLELMNQGELRDKSIIQFLIEKTKTVDTPMADTLFVKEFKEFTGFLDSIGSLNYRYRRVRNTIFELPEINKNTKVKMMFISNANLSEDILEKLRKDANVDVDEGGRITKYNADDGSLELGGYHGLFSKLKTARADIRRQRLETILNERKRARGVSVEDDDVEKSMKVEDDWKMDFDRAHPSYELDMEHIPQQKKPECLLEVKEEVPDEASTSIGGDHFFFDYDTPTYEEDLDQIPVEEKPEELIEIKKEEGPYTSNLE